MAKLVKIESTSKMVFTPKDGYITNTIGEVEGQITELVKKSDGTIVTMGGGGATEFYKCASVDTTAKTWSGYKAVLTDGVYTFAETVTAGLSYTSVTPSVGKVYSADALVAISSLYAGIPVDGLVFYVPLASASSTAETGHAIITQGTVTYGEVNGIPCAYINGTAGSCIYSTDSTNIPVGSSASTMSVWVNFKTKSSTNDFAFTYGRGYDNALRGIGCIKNWETGIDYIAAATYGSAGDTYSTVQFTEGVWHHICASFSGNKNSLYIDGILAAEKDYSELATDFLAITLGGYFSDIDSGMSEYSDCYLAGARIYNRVLTAEEVARLASEFTPTA